MRIALLLIVSTFLTAAAFAQSGRRSANQPSPQPAQTRPTASPSPNPDTQLPKSPKPELPRFVDGERIYTSKETAEHYEILNKPAPRYNRTARRHMTHGIVVLRAILAADATVKHIEIETGLPDGLSEEAVKVAQQIRFRPARKDDKAVSVWVELEYHFDIY